MTTANVDHRRNRVLVARRPPPRRWLQNVLRRARGRRPPRRPRRSGRRRRPPHRPHRVLRMVARQSRRHHRSRSRHGRRAPLRIRFGTHGLRGKILDRGTRDEEAVSFARRRRVNRLAGGSEERKERCPTPVRPAPGKRGDGPSARCLDAEVAPCPRSIVLHLRSLARRRPGRRPPRAHRRRPMAPRDPAPGSDRRDGAAWAAQFEAPYLLWNFALGAAGRRCADGGAVVAVCQAPAALDAPGRTPELAIADGVLSLVRSVAAAEGPRGSERTSSPPRSA